MKKISVLFLSLIMLLMANISVFAENSRNIDAENQFSDFKVDANSAILIEANTGKILYKQDEDNRASSASVTKVMTLLLVMEAVEDGRISLDDKVTISSYASSMGGSQVFLEEGETMSVEELIKCTVIASANDAAVALAEHVGGSEKMFVNMMNKRAKELKLENTNFENVTGLDDTTVHHFTSAEDIGIMSCNLIKYDTITKYSSLWQDTIREGAFTLTNTNRLVRFYDGCNGLKTGSTDKAGYCISAAAKRDGMQLIAVIMGASTRDIRNEMARQLLDYGFANYALYTAPDTPIENVEIRCGTVDNLTVYSKDFCTVVPKNLLKKVDVIYDIPEFLNAPVSEGDIVGRITYKLADEVIGNADIYSKENIEKINVLKIFTRILSNIFKG